jgi:hypothetical protein
VACQSRVQRWLLQTFRQLWTLTLTNSSPGTPAVVGTPTILKRLTQYQTSHGNATPGHPANSYQSGTDIKTSHQSSADVKTPHQLGADVTTPHQSSSDVSTTTIDAIRQSWSAITRVLCKWVLACIKWKQGCVTQGFIPLL